MQLPEEKGVLVENANRLAQAKFVQLVLTEFPQLHKELAEAEGLLHLQMSAWSRFTQEAIERNDLDTLKRCYALLSGIMKTTSPEVENAIHVSFLEQLDFESSPYGAEARRQLPPALKKAWNNINEHWGRMGQWQVEAQDNQQRARDEESKKKQRRT